MTTRSFRSVSIAPGSRGLRQRTARNGAIAVVLLALASTGAWGADQGEVAMQLEAAQQGPVQARSFAGGAPAALDLESLPITVTLPSGRAHHAYLITVHDPESGLFWWTFEGAGPGTPTDRLADLRSRWTFFVSEREIVGVQLATPPPSLWLLRSASHVASWSDARDEAIDQVASRARAIEDGTARWLRSVSLWNAVPKDFFYAPDHAQPRLEMTITGFDRRPGGWTATLAGRGDRHAEVALDDNFVLLSARLTD